jgi:hypothetical protein
MIHSAWRYRAIKVYAIVDLHRNLVTGLERKWPHDLSREVRILARAHHTFGGLNERWTDIFAAGPAVNWQAFGIITPQRHVVGLGHLPHRRGHRVVVELNPNQVRFGDRRR